MANLVPMMLGRMPFSVSEGGFTDIQRQTSWRVDQPEPLEGLGTPAHRGQQYDELTIRGVSFPGQAGARNSVQRLRDAGDAGKSLLLVDGEGTLYGHWMIRSLNESKSHFLASGIERRAAWELVLIADPSGLGLPL